MLNLFESKNVYEVIDSVQSSLYWKDLDGKYLGCNKYMLDLAGISNRGDVIGKTDFELFGLDVAKDWQKNDRKAVENGMFEGEEIFTSDDGRLIAYWSVKHRLLDSENNIIGLVGSSLNISAKKEEERLNLQDHKEKMEREKQQAILNERLKIAQIIDLVDASIYWKDVHGVMLGCNQYVLDLFGTKDRQEIIGKNEYGLLNEEDALRITKIDQFVLANGHYGGEEFITLPSGEKRIYFTVKNRLLDCENNVTGIVGTSVDITSKKETERLKLKLESERQQVALQEKEKFVKIARKVAHDINSPLASLKMMLPACSALPEVPRNILNQAINSILDIANNLLSTYKKEEHPTAPDTEPRQPLLISDLLVQLLSEKKVQYSSRSVKLETDINFNAQFAFAQIQPSQFRRSMSNLINNAVDALDDNSNGIVQIKLEAYTEFVIVTIQDNGKGMSSSMVEKMMKRQNFTAGKVNGHGLGLQQVWDTLDNNEGTMQVDSNVGTGTSVSVAFPRIEAASWIAHRIQIVINGIVVILDDDESIHGAWNLRFRPFLDSSPTLRLYHFTHGQHALDFFNGLSTEDQERVTFLSDYELIGQDKNGLQIIEISGIQNTTLVTSYYANPQIRDRATQLGVKILPKQMASIVPIDVVENPPDSEFKDIEVIFVDDEEYLLDGFRFFASGKKVDTYNDPKIFLNNLDQYHKHTKIILDQNFANSDSKGIQIAEQLHGLGFQRLYLCSGAGLPKSDIPHYLTFIYKGEMDTLRAALDE